MYNIYVEEKLQREKKEREKLARREASYKIRHKSKSYNKVKLKINQKISFKCMKDMKIELKIS